MLRHLFSKAFFAPALALAALACWPTVSHAQFKAGDFELTLGGTGTNNRQFTSSSIGAEGSLGYFLTPEIEFSLRENATYASIEHGGDSFTSETRAAADYNIPLGKLVPFIGANIGYAYGTHGFKDTFEVAPEAGVKYFLNSTTFIFGLAEYDITFRHGHNASFSDGFWLYSLGLGLRL